MDKKLFGAAVAANLIDINEGKAMSAAGRATISAGRAAGRATVTTAKFVNKHAPATISRVGGVTKYVGDQVQFDGRMIHKIGTRISKPRTYVAPSPHLSKFGGDKVAGALNHVANRGAAATGVVTRGVGNTLEVAGKGISQVGKKIKHGGDAWTGLRNKKISDAAAAEKQKVTDAENAEKQKAQNIRNTEDDEIRRKHIRDIEAARVERYKDNVKAGRSDMG